MPTGQHLGLDFGDSDTSSNTHWMMKGSPNQMHDGG